MIVFKFFIMLMLFFFFTLNAKSDLIEDENKPLKLGNLAVAPSQQPNPMISFGQNIVEKGVTQGFLLTTDLHGRDHRFTNIVPSILYGITDQLSIFISQPFTPQFKDRKFKSSGVEDLSIQFEYAFYNNVELTFFDQATLVGNITIPFGSSKKNPPTGYGATSFFIGETFSRTMIDWLFFVSPGAIFPTSHHRTRFGNQFLYQFGFGRNITNINKWLFTWMVEFDGVYALKNKIRGKLDQNSGGNTIIITPSIWISSEKFILQCGLGYTVYQKNFGKQNRDTYLFALNAGWTF